MKKIMIYALMFVLFLSGTFFPAKAKEESRFMVGNVENAALGSYVTLAGMTWRLIGDNYIILNQPLNSMVYGKNNYVDYASSDIRNYLNNDFLNNFGSAKRLISIGYWGIGTEAFEYNSTVNDKISLPCYSDSEVIKKVFGKSAHNIWTRTKVDRRNYSFWSLNLQGGSIIQQHYSDKSDVYPVLTIAPNVGVTGKGTEKNPYVISELPGQDEKTRVVGVKLDYSNINIKVGQSHNLIPLFIYGDENLKQIVNPDKYLYDKSLSGRITAPEYEVIVTGDKIKYSSSNTDVAEVTKMGYVVAKKAGVSVITVKGLGWTAIGIVTVK
ncbi:hypothetical protein CLMAG_46810 [Clostridium magnum DSM 2767]|uniref:BIG2 domain-containing protein n=1 Tax=Clostridium magnum DSM 2767 TaxID=1121326 RepID=A0A162RP27_9CLOT|nr:hypothetical protein CLMAG_46810 [Clostridium magnum DSM 2767]SHH63775.1 hypothetical protein SAMN02745944_01061 [Clostridium magnum DSM 2767]